MALAATVAFMRAFTSTLCLVLLVLGEAHGQGYPERPIRLIVGSAPQAFGKFVTGEIAQWKAVAKAGGIKTE